MVRVVDDCPAHSRRSETRVSRAGRSGCRPDNVRRMSEGQQEGPPAAVIGVVAESNAGRDPSRRDAGDRTPADRPRVRRGGRVGRRREGVVHRRGVRRGRRADRPGRGRLAQRTSCSRSTRRRSTRSPSSPTARRSISLISPALNPDLVDGSRAAADHGARDGRRAAHLARAVDGRAQLDGQHRRLPRGHRGGARVRPVLHRARSPRPARCRRPRCWSPVPASPASPRSARPAAWARSCVRPTRGPRSPTRSRRSAASTSPVDVENEAERRRLRQGDVARTTTGEPPRSTPSRPPTSTSSSRPR